MRFPWRGTQCVTVVALLALLGACGDRERQENTAEDAAVEPGGTAIVGELADLNTPSSLLFAGGLDGSLTSDALNMELLRAEWRDGELVHLTAEESPLSLARRYEYLGADSTSIRFHMRSDVRWSDGRPLTAHDVVFTYEWARDPELASPRQDYVRHLRAVEAENDSVVTFHFTRRYPEMITHTGIIPMPRHVYDGSRAADLRSHPSIQDPANHMVVSGPFRIGEWQRGQRFTLVRNPHFRPQAHLEQIVFRVIPEPTTRVVEMQTGAIDMTPTVTFDQIPQLVANAPQVRLERQEKRFYDYVAYNPARYEPFGDAEIRRALGLAIDKEAMIQGLQMAEYAVPGGGPYSPIFKDLYDPQTAAPLPFDAEEARRILAAKGWRDTDGDGIVEKDGRPFRFTLVTNVGNQRRADAMQIIQQQWRRIGVDAQLQTVEFNTFFGALMEKSYQAALGGWQVALSPDITQLWSEGAPLNIVGYSNPQLEQLFEQAQQQPTQAAAAPYWRQAAAQLARDQPYTWLYFFDSVDAVHERLRGVRINSYGAYQNTWEWWIPANMRRGAAGAPAPTGDTTAGAARP